MALDLLKRELAPILPPAFAAVDAEAARVLKLNLAGRRSWISSRPTRCRADTLAAALATPSGTVQR
jgi:uncharacterized linocin/CFP29 family protein